MIYALDVATHTGFAVGKPGEIPVSGVVTLKKPSEPPAVAFANLIAFLDERLRAKPAMIAKESQLPLQAYRNLDSAAATVGMTYGLHAIVDGMARRFGIPVVQATDSTIRKHFIGRGKLGTRSTTKREVVARCHLLKLMPADCLDDNRADALATWDWACATHARAPIDARELRMFGERVPA